MTTTAPIRPGIAELKAHRLLLILAYRCDSADDPIADPIRSRAELDAVFRETAPLCEHCDILSADLDEAYQVLTDYADRGGQFPVHESPGRTA